MRWFKHKTLSDASHKNGVGLITATAPGHQIAEQFRTVRTNIQFSSVNHPVKSILFTSSAPSEGKSTMSNNLAVTWASQGARVVLVDADLRRPTVHQTFDVTNRLGMTNFLSGVATLAEVVQATTITNLSVVTSGPMPPNPAELLGSSRLKRLLQELQASYDLIIVDAPPVNTVTDSQLLAAEVDGTILVVPQGIATKNGVRRAQQLLQAVHANVLGAVMNRVTDLKSDGYYGQAYQGYYGRTDN
ncbi:CpsD/CapB family tyrosine-protein kinase [Levilactobacillus tongjiangensis]|uniref:CpsD/CapB family tyrosine-protein kinase n=1 Tax=Levilactobacillus tongjiangensis TaxID=2486023 RepID=A0ABW1SUB5_9LACO|nr:CpsD/CapB family tyrosine-protein kinase [Levilactobacillus tongjiangensis]